MIEINPARFIKTPYAHQLEGVKALTRYRSFALFDEQGAGKSKQVIDAACILYEAGEIDVVVIVAPNQVADVWLDPDFGEIVTHNWVPAYFCRYDAREPNPVIDDCDRLQYVLVSYEYERQEDERGEFPMVEVLLDQLYKKHKTLLVVEESSCVANHKSAQSRATKRLRKYCDRCVLLNGTPITKDKGDLYSQFEILDKTILGYKNYYHFRAKHLIMGGFNMKKVVGYKDWDVVEKKIAPYILRRLKRDCIDLPELMPPSFFTVPLSAKTWRVYQQMKNEMIAEIDRGTLLVEHAAVKHIRLGQLTSGFLGGWVNELTMETEVEEISSEKTDGYVTWLKSQVEANPNFRSIVWCRWTPEIYRLAAKTRHLFKKDVPVVVLNSATKDEENDRINRYFHPDFKYDGPALLIGQPQAGRFGKNYTRAAVAVYLSQDYNLLTRSQSEARIDRPGQRERVSLVDVIATGPMGQKTQDHHVRKSLINKLDVATLTAKDWRKVLMEEM